MLEDVFKNIKINKKYYSSAENGDQFEQNFKSKLKTYGFTEIVQRSKTKSAIEYIANIEGISKNESSNIYNNIKKRVLLKNTIQIEKNPYKIIKNYFIFQPYGSQQFPDFIVFIEEYIIPIEIKFSKNEKGKINLNIAKPMWNSNIPKPNSIYIYGISNEIVTFFMGSDILDSNTRKHLLDFFEDMEKGEDDLNKKIEGLKNNFGIYPYIRKAYEHKTTMSTYIDLKGKQVVESYFSENAEKRETNVIRFLKSLNKNKKNLGINF